ncbi:MAG: ABC transporter permease [Desulfuromonadales bacterium]|nr:ABC transporter permease [Desulfuromonadales bacterium]
MVTASLRTEKGTDGSFLIILAGDWKLGNQLPSLQTVTGELSASDGSQKVTFGTHELGDWDSGLIIFLLAVISLCAQQKIDLDRQGLPAGVNRLLTLATAVPEQQGTQRNVSPSPLLARIGLAAIDFWQSQLEFLAFIGEASASFGRLCTGRAQFRRADVWIILQECSSKALPIVSLISLLVGLILAFVGAIQLKPFGAQIYVANLVGIATVRTMGAVMTGVIIAGRTGAAFAATIGTMRVNEEIDALKTTGISPMDYLVLPRMLVLALMMPLLCLYADLMGILGGLLVGVFGLDLGAREYYQQTLKSVSLTNVWIGLVSAFVYGVLVALSGCMRGMQCGRSASAVGDATTSSVVTAIVCIVVATAIITIICNILRI